METLEDRRLLATYVWDGGGGDALWSNLANWDVSGSNPTALPSSADTVTFQGATPQTVTVDDAYTVGGIKFTAAGYTLTPQAASNSITLDNGASAGSLFNSVGSNAIDVDLNLPAPPVVITVDVTAGELTLGGTVTANGQVNKNGAGALILSGDNPLTGGWVDVNAGVISLRSNGAAIGSYFHVTNPNAVVELHGGVNIPSGRIVYLSGTATTDNPAFRSVNGDNTWNGNLVLHTGNGDRNVGVDAGSTLSITGTVSSGGNLVKVGDGTLILSGASNYSGSTRIKNGTLQLAGGANRLPTGTSLHIDSGKIFDLNGQNQTINLLTCAHGQVQLSGGAMLTVGGGDVWASSVFTGTGGLTKAGSGILTFGANTANYTGGTFVAGGRLWLYYGNNKLPQTGDVTIEAAGTLDLAHSNNPGAVQTIGRLLGSGTVNIGTAGKSVNLVVGNGNFSSTFSGSIQNGSGTVSLTKTGTGRLMLTGASSYTGGTTVDAGQVNLQNGAALGTGAVSVAGGATLELENNITVAGQALTLSPSSSGGMLRNLSGDNVWTGSVNTVQRSYLRLDAGSLTISGTVTAAGQAIKDGTGTLILTGNNAASGWMDVNGGVVSLRSSTAAVGSYFHVGNSASAVELHGGVSIPSERRIYLSGAASNDNPSFRSVSGDNTWNGIVTLHNGNGDRNIGVDAHSSLTLAGTVNQSSIGNLVKVGDGVLVLTGTATYTGTTTVKAGMLLVNSSLPDQAANNPDVTVTNGATLGGTGTVNGQVLVQSGGHLAPGTSPGIQNYADLTLAPGANFDVDLWGIDPGIDPDDYDQAVVSNWVTLTDANLNLDFGTVPFVPGAGETYTIIDLTHATNTVTGEFTGKPNGGIFVAGGHRFGIRYDAGTGNDVVLYALPAAAPSLLYVNDDWSTLTPFTPVDGDLEQDGTQTAYVGYDAFGSIENALDAYSSYAGPIVVNGGTYDSALLTGGGAVELRLVQDLTDSELNVTLQEVSGDAGDGIVTRYYNAANANLTIEQGAFGGVISGPGTLTKTTAGTLTLSGSNAYSGATIISAGILQIGSGTALGTGSVTMQGIGGGQLDLNGQTIANTVIPSYQATGPGNAGCLVNSNTSTTAVLNGPVQLGGNNYTGGNGSVTINGLVTDGVLGTGNDYAIYQQGPGTWTFANTGNTFDGWYYILGGGTTVVTKLGNLNEPSSLGRPTTAATNRVRFVGGGGTLRYVGSTASTSNREFVLSGTSNVIDASGAVPAATLTLTGPASGGTLTLRGPNGGSNAYQGPIGGATALTKAGTGTWMLSGNNSYTGHTLVSGGTLRLGSGTALGTGSVTLQGVGGGQLDLNGQTIANTVIPAYAASGPGNTGCLVNSNTSTPGVINGPVQLGGNNYTGGNGDITFNGLITGGVSTGNAYAMFKQGSGTMTFSRPDNTFDGWFYIVGGTVAVTKLDNLGSPSSLGQATSPLTNRIRFDWGSGTLRYIGSTASTTDRELVLGGTSNVIDASGTDAAATLTLSGLVSAGPLTLSGANTGANSLQSTIGGASTLTKSGTGTWLVSGNNAYIGATTVSDGALQLGHPNALGTTAGATSVQAGATVDLNGQTGVAEGVNLNGLGVGGNGALINSNASAAGVSGNIYAASQSSIVNTGGKITLSGTVATNAYQLTLGGTGDIDKIGASFTIAAGGELIKNGSGTLSSAGHMNVGPGAKYTHHAGTTNISGVYGLNVSGSSAGDGVVTQTGGTINTLGPYCIIGSNAGDSGGKGVYNMQGGTLNANGTFYSAWVGNGQINQTGGDVRLGNLDSATDGGYGEYYLRGGTLTATGHTHLGYRAGTSTDFVQSGGSAAFGTLVLGGVGTGGTGNYTINTNDGASTLTVGTGGLFVGHSGSGAGNLTIDGGTVTVNGDLTIGRDAATTGAVTQTAGSVTIAAGRTLRFGNGTAASGTYNLNGGTLTLANIAYADAATQHFYCGGGTLQANGNLTAAMAMTINAGGAVVDTNGHSVQLNGALDGAGGLTKTGPGTLDLTATNTYSGPTTVSNGTLLVNGSIADSAVTVQAGATLGGTGTTGPLTIAAGGFHKPGNSPGITTVVGNDAEHGALEIEIATPSGNVPGTDYDQTQVIGGGSVTIGTTATLSVPYLGTAGTFAPGFGQVYTIIDNDGSDPLDTTGTFSGLPDGTGITVDTTKTLKIYYHGGDGNDLVLVSADGTPDILYVNDQWTAPGMVDGDLETGAYETAYVGIDAFASIAAALAAYPSYAGPIVVNGGTYDSALLTGGGAVELRLVQDLANSELDVTLKNVSGDAGTPGDQIVTRYWNVANANLTIEQGAFAGVISGNGNLTKTTAGTLVLSNAGNTYAGGTTVAASGGTLQINTPGALQGATSVGTGGTLQLNSSGSTYTNTFSGNGLIQLVFSTGVTNTYMQNVTGFTGTIQLANTGATGDKWNVNNLNAGGAALQIDSGSQLFVTGGTVTFASITVLGAGNTEGRGAIRAVSGTLAGNLTLLGNTTIGTEGGTIAGNITSGAAGTQTLTTGGPNDFGGGLTLSGAIGGGIGTIKLQVNNTGLTRLTGNSSYTGGTELVRSGAQLQVEHSNALGTGPVTAAVTNGNYTINFSQAGLSLPAGNTFTFTNPSSITFGGSQAATIAGDVSLSSGDVPTYNFTNAGGLTFAGTWSLNTGAGAGIIFTGGGNATLNGPVQDGAASAKSLTYSGTGTLTLGGTGNSYSGDTLVSRGTLKLGAAGVIPDGAGKGKVSLDYAGTLDLAGFSETVNGLSGQGMVDNSVAGGPFVLSVGNNNATSTFAGAIRNTTGTVTLTKVGLGTLTLANYSTYSGATNVTAGTLRLDVPTSPLPGGLYWLDASDAASVTSDGSNYVSQWGDKSGNSRNFTQATAANQPLYVAGSLNGLGVIRFDGASVPNNDRLVMDSSTAPQSVFIVNRPRFDTGYKSLAGIWGVSGNDVGIRATSSTSWQHPGNSNDFSNPAGSAFYINGLAGSNFGGTTTPHVLEVIRSTALTMSATAIGDYWGSTYNRQYAGDLAELVAFGRTLTAVDRQNMENYLQMKWFGAAAANLLPTATPVTIIGGATLDLNNLNTTIGSLTGAGDVTLGGGTLTVGTDNTSPPAYRGAISGIGGLTKIGTGTLTLAGTGSSYSGETIVNAGTLQLGASQVIPDGAGKGNASIGYSGTLDLGGFDETINGLSGQGFVDNSVAGGPYTLTVGNSDATSTFAGVIRNTAGTLDLTKTGAGTLTLTNWSTYSGATNVAGGTLRLDVPTSPLPGGLYWLDASDAASVTSDGGNYVSQWGDKSGNNRNFAQGTAASQPRYVAGSLNGLGVIRFDGANVANNDRLVMDSSTQTQSVFIINRPKFDTGYKGLAGIWGTSGVDFGIRAASNTSWQHPGDSRDFSNPGGSAFYINGVAGSSFGGTTTPHILEAVRGSAVSMSATAIGDYWGSGTYNGQYAGDIAEMVAFGWALSTGERQNLEKYLQMKWFGAGVSNLLPTATPVTISSGATLDLNNLNTTIGSLTGAGDVTLGSGALTVGTDNTSPAAHSGAISGTSGVTKVGTGTLTLGGANTYSGDTVVNAGTLKIGAAGAIPDGAGKGIVALISGATLDLNGNNESISGLFGGGTVTNSAAAAATLGVGTDDLSSLFFGTIQDGTGAVALTKAGTGAFTLGGNNTYSGDTTISAGTLRLMGPNVTPVSGALYWLDAADAATVSKDGSSYVSQWSDKTANGRDFQQVTAANQPRHGVHTLNGLPVVTFDGSDDRLTLGGVISAQTVFLVNKPTADGGLRGIWGSNNPSDKGIRLLGAGGARWQATGDSNDFTYPQGLMYVGDVQTNSFGSVGTPHVLTAYRGTSHPATYNTTQLGWYYPGRYFQGDVAEVLIYGTALGLKDRLTVEGYLAGKWLVAGPNSIPDSSAVVIADNATLDVDGRTETIGSLATDLPTSCAAQVLLGTGTLTTGGSDATTEFAGQIAGSGSVVKTGGGAWTLSGTNTYTGATAVNAGTLLVTGSLADGTAGTDVTVNNANTRLGGTGTIGGAVLMNAGTIIAPGATAAVGQIGTLTIKNDLTLTATSTYQADITPPGTSDTLAVSGTITLGGANLSVTATSTLDNATQQTYTIVENLGTGTAVGIFDSQGEGAQVTVNGSSVPAYITYRGGSGSLPGLEIQLNTQPVVNGGASANVVDLETQAGGYRYRIDGGNWTNVSGTAPFTFNGGDGDDLLNVTLDGANPLPAVTYNGNEHEIPLTDGNNSLHGDVLHVVGTSGQTVTYLPNGVVNPTEDNDGTVTIVGAAGGMIRFNQLEPIDLFGFGTVNVQFPNGADVVTIANGLDAATNALAAMVISGTSGSSPAVPFESLHLGNNAYVVIDTVTGGSDGADTVTISSADNGHANDRLKIETGGGASDQVIVNGPAAFLGDGAAPVDIEIDTQAIAFNGGTLTSLGGTVDLDAHGGSITTSDSGLDISAATLLATASTGITLDTSVDDLTAANGTSGDITIVEANGLTELNVNAGPGDANLTVSAGSVLSADLAIDITAAAANVMVANGAFGDTDTTAGNAIQTTVGELSVDTSGGNGNQFVRESDGLTELELNAGTSGDIQLAAVAGSIFSADAGVDLTGDDVSVSAVTGIGAAGSAIGTQVSTLDAVNSTSGDIVINEVAAGFDLDVRQAAQDGGAALGPSSIALSTERGNLTVLGTGSGVQLTNPANTAGTIWLDANVTVAATDEPLRRGDVVINQVVTSQGGTIAIDADHDVLGDAAGTISGGSGGIAITADDNAAGPGSGD
ncbi:MAG: hypothetical protein GX575_25245, partial [Candidatus Anammoximicrobium sp.]|nr:hypothetical protein [Candidatus Anammoximicrobium sp.]